MPRDLDMDYNSLVYHLIQVPNWWAGGEAKKTFQYAYVKWETWEWIREHKNTDIIGKATYTVALAH